MIPPLKQGDINKKQKEKKKLREIIRRFQQPHKAGRALIARINADQLPKMLDVLKAGLVDKEKYVRSEAHSTLGCLVVRADECSRQQNTSAFDKALSLMLESDELKGVAETAHFNTQLTLFRGVVAMEGGEGVKQELSILGK